MPRTKSKPGGVRNTYETSNNHASGGGSSLQTWVDTVTYGDNLPDWKTRMKTGRNATTSLSGIKHEYYRRPGSYYALYREPPAAISYYRRSGYSRWVLMSTIPNSNGTLATTSLNRAKNALVPKILSKQRQMQLGVSLGELPETIRMIKSPARALRVAVDRYIDTLKKGRHTVPRRHRRRFLSETWLEHSFGWRPLINDIDQGFKAYERLTDNRAAYITRVTGQGTAQAQTKTTGNILSIGDSAVEKYSEQMIQTATTTIRAWVRVDPAGSPGVVSESLGLRLIDFVPTAWELIPYSFLVDYFTNIGTIIDALTINTARIAFMNKTYHFRATKWQEHESLVLSVGVGFIGMGGTFQPGFSRGTKISFDRAVYTGSLVPDLLFKIPGLGSTKWVNVAALARVKKLVPFF